MKIVRETPDQRFRMGQSRNSALPHRGRAALRRGPILFGVHSQFAIHSHSQDWQGTSLRARRGLTTRGVVWPWDLNCGARAFLTVAVGRGCPQPAAKPRTIERRGEDTVALPAKELLLARIAQLAIALHAFAGAFDHLLVLGFFHAAFDEGFGHGLFVVRGNVPGLARG